METTLGHLMKRAVADLGRQPGSKRRAWASIGWSLTVALLTFAAAGLVNPPPAWAVACTPASSTSGSTTILTFTNTTACDWTVPSGISTVDVIVVGGGGGGGGPVNIATSSPQFYVGGTGGGGGNVTFRTSHSVSGTISVTVGTGGTGGTRLVGTGTSGAGTSGGTSSFGSLTASGGAGGTGNNDNTSPTGVGGGSGSDILSAGFVAVSSGGTAAYARMYDPADQSGSNYKTVSGAVGPERPARLSPVPAPRVQPGSAGPRSMHRSVHTLALGRQWKRRRTHMRDAAGTATDRPLDCSLATPPTTGVAAAEAWAGATWVPTRTGRPWALGVREAEARAAATPRSSGATCRPPTPEAGVEVADRGSVPELGSMVFPGPMG